MFPSLAQLYTRVVMQSSNGRESGGIRHKLGSLFSPRGPQPASRGREDVEHAVFITADVLRELEQGVPTQRRVRAMRELIEIVASKRLEENAVEVIWKAVCDLLQSSRHPPEVRQATLDFTEAMVTGQYSELGVMRAHFFKVLQSHDVEEDTQQRLDLLLALTQGGKDIQYFEEAIGSFLAEWMPVATHHASVEDFLGLLVKLVHYNSAYLEEDILSQLIYCTCSLANQSTVAKETELCLSFLDAVICYAVFPAHTIHTCILTLCHTLNIETFIQRSLEVMQRLLGTHLGHTVIYTMCSVLQDKSHAGNVLLLRGAVFYISMSLWGVKKIDTLSLPFITVLPAILQASLSGHMIVVYEVALSVLRLVRHYACHLEEREWEMVHHILQAAQHHLTQQCDSPPASQLQASLQDVYCSIEQYWEGGSQSIGPAHLFFQLLDNVRTTLPVQSVLSLVHYHSQVIDSSDRHWLQKITDFMHKFYRSEKRSVIRREALSYLGQVMADHWLTQGEPLTQHILLPFLKPLPLEADPDLRCQAVQLLLQFIPSSSPGHAVSMVALLTQVMSRGLQDGAKSRLSDCRAAVFGLIQLLKEAVYQPGPLAGQVFAVLVQFLRQLYNDSCFTATSCVLRINVFNCLLSMRADKTGQVGFYDDNLSDLKYSPFHICTPDGGQRSMPFSRTILHLGGVFEAVRACLSKDLEWEAVFQLLHLLRDTLQCRTLTLSAMPDLSPLVPLLTSLTDGSSARLDLFNTRPNVADVASSVYPLLAILATYPSHLHRRAQHDLVCCLEGGLVGRHASTCTAALTVCSLELQATMKRLLPRVLYRLGQVAATPSMATPTLECLASLIPIPVLVSGFVEEEYLSVFGIALPYANPDRHTPYVVAMAHHVISMWFLRCRMHYRPKVARFITKGLSSYMVDGGREEERGEGRDRMCQDLIETTVDVLARYTYSNISTLPSRSPGADFLVSGGPSKTWALSNYLVTVTTTGEAGGKPGRCAQCMSELRRDHTPSATPTREDLYNLSSSGLCSCWGWGWAEVKVRRPSGSTAWMMCLENRLEREQLLLREATYTYPYGTTEVTGGQGGRQAGGRLEGTELGELETGGQAGQQAGVRLEGTDLGELETGGQAGQQAGGRLEGTDLGELETGGQAGQQAGGRLEGTDLGELETGGQYDGVDLFPWEQTPFPWQLTIEEDVKVEGSSVASDGSPVSPTATVEHMPPLLSYEEDGIAGRSPSLHSTSLLTEQQQLNLVARVYHSSACETSSSSSADDNSAEDGQQKSGDPGKEVARDGGRGEVARDGGRGELARDGGRGELARDGGRGEVARDGGRGEVARDGGRGELARDGGRGEVARDGGRGELARDGGPGEVARDGGRGEVARDARPVSLSLLIDGQLHVPLATPPALSPPSNTQQCLPSNSEAGVGEEPGRPNDPSFVFLQLFHSASFPLSTDHTPLLLAADEATSRAVKLLDLIPPYNTHKIGVVYVGKGQTGEAAILANTSGSSRFVEFLSGLGQLCRLAGCPPDLVYLGGLDRGGSDGNFTYLYHDDTTQLVFHVATLMPTLTSDPQCSNKKLHIGNDFVTLVYNDSGQPYQFGTITGQFSYAEVVVEPLPAAVNRVSVRLCPGLEGMMSVEPVVCSSQQLPILARTKALQANFAALVHVSESPTSLSEHHPSNWLCRLRKIRHIRERCTADHTSLNIFPLI